MNYRRIATFTGWLWIITFLTSIPARFFFYAPVLDNEGNYVTGAGNDAQRLIAIGALLELLLIISNVGTAVVPYSIHKRVHEAGAVAYVTARLVECTFIAIGIVCMLAISTLRQDAPSGTNAALGQGIFAVYDWTFRLGPGVIVGVGNGLILGWLMYSSGLVPPRLALLGLVGGPLIIISGTQPGATLTDTAWAKIAPLLPASGKPGGRWRRDGTWTGCWPSPRPSPTPSAGSSGPSASTPAWCAPTSTPPAPASARPRRGKGGGRTRRMRRWGTAGAG
jgi:hypothetical protein